MDGREVKTPTAQKLVETLLDLRTILGDALIIGGLAVAFHGYERNSTNVDLLYALCDKERLIGKIEICFGTEKVLHGDWRTFRHRKSNVLLNLIPEGWQFEGKPIPSPLSLGQENGYVDLGGLFHLKLLANRMTDIADLITIAVNRMSKVKAARQKIPEELRGEFDRCIKQAEFEIANDPNRPQ